MQLSGTNVPLPVKTDRPIAKGLIFDCLREISTKSASTPVHIGDVLIEKVCGTDCNIIASANR